ncbi:MAG: MMPL family transporter [Gemmatimonadota bacterium]|nr:MMPL family transporter [Gemmatimonadota bacterium]
MLRLWTSRAGAGAALVLAVVAVAAVAMYVDLSPRVEGDFFFARDDPQMLASREVERSFPLAAQLILRVEDRDPLGGEGLADRLYVDQVAALTTDLLAVAGVVGGLSVTTDDPASPLFRRILLTPDPAATNIVLQVDETDPRLLLPRVEAVVARHESAALDVVVSGVPAIVELIRRSLFRDLVVFSSAAVFVFALLMSWVYREAAVVVGTLTTCVIAVGITLLTVHAFGIGIGLLTANLITIVFVLTLSHVVFMTGNWRRVTTAEGSGRRSIADPVTPTREAALDRAVRDTVEGSFWSMATTLLGFASLLVASARPLRELGIAGVVGAATALVVAYLVYPAFLGGWAQGVDTPGDETGDPSAGPEPGGRPRPGRWIVPGAVVLVLAMGLGVMRIDTDPGLLTYFADGSELRDGLSKIDADGGSSTLDVVVADPEGGSVAAPGVFGRLVELQTALEADAAVGVVLSPALLIEHARTIPLARLLPVPMLLDIASGEALGGVALGFVTPDRDRARFSLRMRETVNEPRGQVLARVEASVRGAGLTPVVVAGLYDLQAQLGRLIASSLRIGIGGLLLLFFGVALVVSRSGRLTLTMWLCLASIPVVTLGVFGHFGVSLDLITSPAANIALAIGADSMIHLVVRVRRLGETGSDAWPEGVRQIGPPVLSATAIVCAGFGIFALSSFPPTQRFGFAVIVGTMTAAFMALAVMPRLALTLENTVPSSHD